MAYSPKSHGLSYLRHAVAHRNKKLNYISLPVDKAEEILESAGGFQPTQNQYNNRSNSVKGAAVVLAMDLKELIERLNCPTPSKILNDLAEARNRIKAMEEAGDVLARTAPKDAIKAWVSAKSL
jgi:hypothetical protein